jgi:hypothetical protein
LTQYYIKLPKSGFDVLTDLARALNDAGDKIDPTAGRPSALTE